MHELLGADPDHLAAAVIAALDAALAVDAHSVALPAISAGIFGYPRHEAAAVIARVAAEAARRDEQIAEILNSTSWRLTAPVRWFKQNWLDFKNRFDG